VLDADALTLFRRWTRCAVLVADKDNELECDRFDEDIRGKPPETGRETGGSYCEQSTPMLTKQP